MQAMAVLAGFGTAWLLGKVVGVQERGSEVRDQRSASGLADQPSLQSPPSRSQSL